MMTLAINLVTLVQHGQAANDVWYIRCKIIQVKQKKRRLQPKLLRWEKYCRLGTVLFDIIWVNLDHDQLQKEAGKQGSFFAASQSVHAPCPRKGSQHWREKEHLFRKPGSEPKLKPSNLLLQWWFNDNYSLSFQVCYIYTHIYILCIQLSFQVGCHPNTQACLFCFHASSPSTNPLWLSSSSSPCSLGRSGITQLPSVSIRSVQDFLLNHLVDGVTLLSLFFRWQMSPEITLGTSKTMRIIQIRWPSRAPHAPHALHGTWADCNNGPSLGIWGKWMAGTETLEETQYNSDSK